jgi:hypothetical protein
MRFRNHLVALQEPAFLMKLNGLGFCAQAIELNGKLDLARIEWFFVIEGISAESRRRALFVNGQLQLEMAVRQPSAPVRSERGFAIVFLPGMAMPGVFRVMGVLVAGG